jgi:hypothetical protein
MGLVGLSGVAGLLAVPMSKPASSEAAEPLGPVPLPPETDDLPSNAATVARPARRARDVLRAVASNGDSLVVRVHAEPPRIYDSSRFAIDDSDETAWIGHPAGSQWRWEVALREPVHATLIRANFGDNYLSGVPTALRWEARSPRPGATRCDASADGVEDYLPLRDAADAPPPPNGPAYAPTRRSWFVDVDICALRLVVDKTTCGPPIMRQLHLYDGASNVLLGAKASDGSTTSDAQGAVDGTYERYWAGQPGARQWALVVSLAEPTPIDRIRLVLGWDAVSTPRGPLGSGPGRNYAIAYAPVRYALEVSSDGSNFVSVASTPLSSNSSSLPLRRRLVTLPNPRLVRSLRLAMDGATGPAGVPDPGAMPVVRELSAYRADDPRPVIPEPWLLSVNTNPTAQMQRMTGGARANDAYFAGFVQRRFTPYLAALRGDDFYARVLGPRDELLPVPKYPAAGRALESVEADDPALGEALLAGSSPPPITVLSGSNRWDYPLETTRDRALGPGWPWDPLRDAEQGGVGQLAAAVKRRSAPFLGFCGGAQVLALLEAKGPDGMPPDQDQEIIDSVIRRTTGRPLRTPAPKQADIRSAWPGDGRPRVEVTYNPYDPLFEDIAGTERAGAPLRDTTRAFAERHEDVIRPDAFLSDGPLRDLVLVATSKFCGPEVVAGGPRDPTIANPAGSGRCVSVPEVFRARDGAYPVVGTQFHPEQSDYPFPAPGDPPETLADPLLFLTAVYEHVVDAYLSNAR